MPEEQPQSTFDYQGAIEAGYNDEEILDHLVKSHPDFDVNGAFGSGYSSKEINDYLSTRAIPKKEEEAETSLPEQAGRLASLYGIARVAGSAPGLAYDIGVAPLGSKGFTSFNERARIGEELEFLYDKNMGKPLEEWSEKDKELYDSLERQIKPGGQLETVPEPTDLSIKGLTEKLTGIDFTPRNTAEKAVEWMGYARSPKGASQLSKVGTSPKEIFKAIAPSGSEFARGLGAGVALQFAEDGNFGPIGTLAAAVVGDLAGSLGKGILKTGARLVTQPKQVLAETAAKFTKQEKAALQKDIIDDFRASGIQADIGTLTDNELVKMAQTRLAQSGLVGEGLENLKKQMTEQIKAEYNNVAQSLGVAKQATAHEAGVVAKEQIKAIRDTELGQVRQLYQQAENSLKTNAKVDGSKVLNAVMDVEQKLLPGEIKSTEQTAVLKLMEQLKTDLVDITGNPTPTRVKNLMNNKIALNDIINYEAQEGTKKLLKGVVAEIDRAIVSHGKDNPAFAKNYINANKRFSQHAKTFRNRRVATLLQDNDPATLMNKMNSIQGINDLENILSKTLQGKDIMNSLKRFKLDEVVGKNMVDSISEQAKLGTFAKLLEKGKNRDIIRHILPKESYNRLVRLQKNAGRLAESAQKFLNPSKSGAALIDYAIVSKVLTDLGWLLTGNPFPLAKSAGGFAGMRYLTSLLGDPEFLKIVEDTIIAASQNNTTKMDKLAEKLVQMAKPALAKYLENEEF